MNPFAHFILTRFNVPLPAAAAPDRLDERWLARRFDLLENVCLPSLDRQIEGAFQWLVFLDWATPLAFKERMAALTVRHEFLRPVFCSQFDDPTVLAEVRRREDSGRIRITTNLDSDDALHPRMVAEVHELARRPAAGDLAAGYLVTFPLGCAVRQDRLYLQWNPVNPFRSFVSDQACNRTVAGIGLPSPSSPAPAVVSCPRRPLWCQLVHAGNAGIPPRGLFWPWGRQTAFDYLLAPLPGKV